METMHQIDFEQKEDGTVILSQPSGFDGRSVIHLHPEQLRFITRRVCGIKPEGAERIADLERHIAILAGDIEFIVTNDDLRKQIVDCTDGVELIVRLDSIYALAMEFDGGRLGPWRSQQPQEATTGIAINNSDTDPSTAQENATKRDCVGSGDNQLSLEV